jgi:methylglyoxal synthase
MNPLIPVRKRIALVAHDHKKDELAHWVEKNREALLQHELIATGTTGALMEKKLGRKVEQLMSGPLGGDQQLGALIAEGRLDAIIFFWDPLESHAHNSDVQALIRLAVTWNILLACNATTADFLLASPLMGEAYPILLPEDLRKVERKGHQDQ